MKIIRYLLLLPLAVVVIVLSVANRHVVTFNIAPLAYEVDVPLYILLLAVFGLGLLTGGSAVVVAAGRRWQRKRFKKQVPQGAPEQAALSTMGQLPGRKPGKFPISLNLRRKPGYMEDI